MNGILFWNLLAAHLCSDFLLQTDTLCREKRDRVFKSRWLYVHAVTAALVAGLFSWSGYALCIALLTGITHFAIDGTKSWIESKNDELSASLNFCVFLIDQCLHIGVIVGISYLPCVADFVQFGFITEKYQMLVPVIISAMALCTTPANIVIKTVLKSNSIPARNAITQKGEQEKDVQPEFNGGALIGSFERLLSLLLILIGQYEAVGFVIAAKSLLRFKDSDGVQTEYVLVGTLLSYCIVFGIAESIKFFFM